MGGTFGIPESPKLRKRLLIDFFLTTQVMGWFF